MHLTYINGNGAFFRNSKAWLLLHSWKGYMTLGQEYIVPMNDKLLVDEFWSHMCD